MVQEAMEIKRRKLGGNDESSSDDDEEEEVEGGTMVKAGGAGGDSSSTMKLRFGTTETDSNTMIEHGDTINEGMGTMVINDDDGDGDMGTMQRYDTGPTPANGPGDRPAFMNYFDNMDNQRGSGSGNSGPKKEGLPPEEAWKFNKNITEMDFDFLKNLSIGDLQCRYESLDMLMEKEIEDLRKRYHEKRQPILDAIDAKKRRQQNF